MFLIYALWGSVGSFPFLAVHHSLHALLNLVREIAEEVISSAAFAHIDRYHIHSEVFTVVRHMLFRENHSLLTH